MRKQKKTPNANIAKNIVHDLFLLVSEVGKSLKHHRVALQNRAKWEGVLIAPAPGSSPPPEPVGYFKSSFVVRKMQPGLCMRYWKAFDNFVQYTNMSRPQTTAGLGVNTPSEKGASMLSVGCWWGGQAGGGCG